MPVAFYYLSNLLGDVTGTPVDLCCNCCFNAVVVTHIQNEVALRQSGDPEDHVQKRYLAFDPTREVMAHHSAGTFAMPPATAAFAGTAQFPTARAAGMATSSEGYMAPAPVYMEMASAQPPPAAALRGGYAVVPLHDDVK